ncbi:transcription antitermination factor NusB [Litorimonas sp. RW-G-Af-16]|uniref:transcription antitermination factor NusB n=1 Tax=Litorimonas sp. RW-G-Af-16 TaxID=3241168 RepID=UPI00390CAEC5
MSETRKSSGANPKLRRAARTSAVQALYQMELSADSSNAVVKQFLDHRFGHEDEPGMIVADEDFFEDIIRGAVRFQDDIDAAISAKLPEKWPLRRLDMTLRAVLRSGAYEILRRPDIPALVIISEYVKVAGSFFDGKEPGMVNAVIEAVAKQARGAEFGIIGEAIPQSADLSEATVSPSEDTKANTE